MLNIEDIKLINKALDSVNDEEFLKLKEKISLVCQQIEINEKAQQEIASLQDKIVDIQMLKKKKKTKKEIKEEIKEVKEENEEKQEEVKEIEKKEEIFGELEG